MVDFTEVHRIEVNVEWCQTWNLLMTLRECVLIGVQPYLPLRAYDTLTLFAVLVYMYHCISIQLQKLSYDTLTLFAVLVYMYHCISIQLQKLSYDTLTLFAVLVYMYHGISNSATEIILRYSDTLCCPGIHVSWYINSVTEIILRYSDTLCCPGIHVSWYIKYSYRNYLAMCFYFWNNTL